jgi:hypothetical protein
MKYLYFFIILVCLSACEEETIFPEGSEKLPGIYEGSISTLKDADSDVIAIVDHIENNRYTIEIKDCNYLELPVFEIEISEIQLNRISFDILNEGCLWWGRDPGHFGDYRDSYSYIALTLTVSCKLQEKYTGLLTFSGRKYDQGKNAD